MLKHHLPKSHPRYHSLVYRNLLADGVSKGITSFQGLVAHGRGEAFDYLLDEKTHPFAQKAIRAAAAMMVLAEQPILSVNGNTAVLVAREFVSLANFLPAKLEVNLFHPSRDRERRIAKHLKREGARGVLLPKHNPGKGGSRPGRLPAPNIAVLPGLESNRKYVHPAGIYQADVVFVPLEDGDRTEALISLGKKVITVDLNPLSRTAQKASITIVDNIVRAMPLLFAQVKTLAKKEESVLNRILAEYKNNEVLADAEREIRLGISPTSRQ